MSPFKSEKQRRYLQIHDPKLAKKWSDRYGSKPVGKSKTTRTTSKKKGK